MATTVWKIETGELGFSLTDPGGTLEDDVIANYSDFSCVVTAGTVVSTQNINAEDVPGTFCSPGTTSSSPQATTFTLDVSVLQDPQDDAVTGLAKFCYDNDSGESGTTVYWYMAQQSGAAPKARGQLWLAPMDFGGEARVVLTADASWPCEGRPELEFGVAVDV